MFSILRVSSREVGNSETVYQEHYHLISSAAVSLRNMQGPDLGPP
jgi:hypothetical protein